MQVDAAMSNGERCSLKIDMTPEWCIHAEAPGAGKVELALQAVLPSVTLGLIYLFAASEPLLGMADPLASPLPSAATELLLYAPLVPLLKCTQGFQALTWTSWKELTAATCLQDFGMPISSLAASAAAGDDERSEAASAAGALELAQSLDSDSCMLDSDEELSAEDAEPGFAASAEGALSDAADSDAGSDISL